MRKSRIKVDVLFKVGELLKTTDISDYVQLSLDVATLRPIVNLLTEHYDRVILMVYESDSHHYVGQLSYCPPAFDLPAWWKVTLWDKRYRITNFVKAVAYMQRAERINRKRWY